MYPCPSESGSSQHSAAGCIPSIHPHSLCAFIKRPSQLLHAHAQAFASHRAPTATGWAARAIPPRARAGWVPGRMSRRLTLVRARAGPHTARPPCSRAVHIWLVSSLDGPPAQGPVHPLPAAWIVCVYSTVGVGCLFTAARPVLRIDYGAYAVDQLGTGAAYAKLLCVIL